MLGTTSATNERVLHLKRSIESRQAVIGVVGLGYVGLPLAVEKGKVGFEVLGFDRNRTRVAQVNSSLNYIRDVADADLQSVVERGLLRAQVSFESLQRCDVIVICVPTPLTRNRDPDISYITKTAHEIVKRLRPGQLICLESTTYPGTTEEILLPILEGSGLRAGDDFFLAFSPERVDPGNKRYTTSNTSKVVGGVTAACTDVAKLFYAQTIGTVVTVSAPRVAEMTKVFENTFRAVNIALVNEMALLCDRLDINVWEVIDAAATKPFGIMRFDPGPGVGGHCIPIDPFYLAWKAREFDFSTRFIELAGQVNLQMPYFVREKVARTLNRAGLALHGAKVCALGVAYKRDIEDWRESPSLKVIELLENDGAEVSYHDPLVPVFSDRGKEYRSVPLTDALLGEADCVVILTDHSSIDWQRVVATSRRVFDTRNATRLVANFRERIELL